MFFKYEHHAGYCTDKFRTKVPENQDWPDEKFIVIWEHIPPSLHLNSETGQAIKKHGTMPVKKNSKRRPKNSAGNLY